MKFVALWSVKESVDQAKLAEGIARRAEATFPKDMKVIAEYWTPTDSPAVISIFEADDVASLMITSMAMAEMFTVEIFPAVTMEEAMEKLGKHLTGE